MSKPVETISVAELSAILRDEKTVSGCTFVGFNAVTEVKLNKTIDGKKDNPNPHFGKIFKVHVGQLGMLFSNKTASAYGKMVNRRLEQEGKEPNFQVSQRSWGERLEGTSFVSHTNAKGEYNEYMSVIYNQSPVSLADYVTNDLGIELSDEDREIMEGMKRQVAAYESKGGEIEYVKAGENGFEPIAKKDIIGLPPSKGEAKQGGLSEGMKVIIRDFKLQGIQSIAIGGKRFIVQ